MQHPVLKSIKNLAIYAVLWIILALVDSFTLFLYYNVDLSVSLTCCFVLNSLFAVAAIAIWYAVLFSFPEKTGIINLIINHLTAVTILVFLWIVSSLFLIRILTTEQVYQFILNYITWVILFGVVYYFIVVLIYYLIIYNNNLKERKENEVKLMEMINEAELNLLKSQINPHFLFNSLNSISSLTITNPAKAQEMIIKLSDFLRYSISRTSNQKSSLKSEIENIQRYLDIEKIRFGSRLKFVFDIEDTQCMSATLPAMILQPLFENAIKHGVYESTETITLYLTCVTEEDFLVISIKNNFDPESPSRKGAGIGLRNIQERLRLIYQSEGLIKINKTENTFESNSFIFKSSAGFSGFYNRYH